MVSRRSQTFVVQEQPVRFYKVIAITFLVLTLLLLGLVVFLSSKRAQIIITTRPAPIDVTSEIVLSNDGDTIVSFEIVTTTIQDTRNYSPNGTEQVVGTAEGVVTIINETASAQPLVATTRLLSPDGVLFRLKNGVTVPANGQLENVEVYADQEGSASDIGPSKFTIPGLNATKQSVIYAKSDTAMTGGIRQVGAISQSDIDQAIKRSEEFLKQQAKTALGPEYTDRTGVFEVLNTSVTSSNQIGERTDAFAVTANATVLAIFYNEEELTEWANTQLEKRAIETSDVIRPNSEKPTVSFVSYDSDAQEATLRVFYDGTVTLSPQSSQVAKEVFFGKSKNEVRRYLLALDHVDSVEVNLQPAWIDKVPQIHEHVSVVVKEVK